MIETNNISHNDGTGFGLAVCVVTDPEGRAECSGEKEGVLFAGDRRREDEETGDRRQEPAIQGGCRISLSRIMVCMKNGSDWLGIEA